MQLFTLTDIRNRIAEMEGKQSIGECIGGDNKITKEANLDAQMIELMKNIFYDHCGVDINAFIR